MILSTDGQTDKVKPVYPPSTLSMGEGGYNNALFKVIVALPMTSESQGKMC